MFHTQKLPHILYFLIIYDFLNIPSIFTRMFFFYFPCIILYHILFPVELVYIYYISILGSIGHNYPNVIWSIKNEWTVCTLGKWCTDTFSNSTLYTINEMKVWIDVQFRLFGNCTGHAIIRFPMNPQVRRVYRPVIIS